MSCDRNWRNKQVGIYRLDKFISGGGMACVWQARITNDRKYAHRNNLKVALKFVQQPDHVNALDFEQLLQDESNLLRSLHHPGVVRVYPIAKDRADQYISRAEELPNYPYYFCMELLDKTTLKTIIHDWHVVPLPWRVQILYQLASTLHYLHAQNIAHRDFKPDNIVFRQRPVPSENPLPVLIDFGLSRRKQDVNEQRRMNDPAARAAAALYASPERIHYLTNWNSSKTLEGINHLASEVWSFGVVAYELLSNGQYIYRNFNVNNGDRTSLSQLIMHQDIDPLTEDIPLRLRQLVYAMLQKNPAHRPSMGAILNHLEVDIDFPSPRM